MKLSSFRKPLWVTLSLGASFLMVQATQADTIPPATNLTLKSLSIKSVNLDIPLVKQEEPRDCGLAVLKMIFGFYGQKLNQAQVDWVKENSKAGQGTAASELITVLGAAEYETALYKGTLDDQSTGIFHQLDKKRPLIVMITSKDGKDSHYDVMTGYDPIRNYIVLMDPALGQIIIHQKDFEAAWKRANNFTLLAVPKKLLPKTPTPFH